MPTTVKPVLFIICGALTFLNFNVPKILTSTNINS